MALSEDVASRLADMIELIDRNRRLLSKWEMDFMFGEDEEWPGVATAFLARGADVVITRKMWPIIERIYWKVTH